MPGPRRLYIHIGLQKTGTSYLQGVMLESTRELATQGLDLVPPTKRESFELMSVIRDRYASRREPGSDEAVLARFSEQLAHATRSRALLSQESLAAATRSQIHRLVAACGDREVHVVVTVRDLARQLPSSWQQDLKAGNTLAYVPYLEGLLARERANGAGHHWIHLDPPKVLARWAAAVPPHRIHVVTVPPAGSSPTQLLERFCRVLEIDPTRLSVPAWAANTSLGRDQAELLRRVNAQLPPELHRRHVYGDVAKRYFAAQVLGSQRPIKILVPAQFQDWCERVTERQIGSLEAAGYGVVGSLEDLRCAASSFSEQEREPTEHEVAASATSALVTILTERGSSTATRPQGRAKAKGLVRRLGRFITRR